MVVTGATAYLQDAAAFDAAWEPVAGDVAWTAPVEEEAVAVAKAATMDVAAVAGVARE